MTVSVVREKELGSIINFYVTPTGRLEYLLGKYAASSDEMAAGAYRAIAEAGLTIPRDVLVIGFDDVRGARWLHPSLTTIHQPMEQMGRVAAETLLKLINDPQFVVERIELPTTLVVRQSCRPRAAS